MRDDDSFRRVRFYGVHDMAVGMHMGRVAEVIEKFDDSKALTAAVDAIELHNVLQYIENGLLPHSYSEKQLVNAADLVPKIKGVVAQFFSAVDETSCAAVVAEIDHKYHADLLELLGRNKVYERCNSAVVLLALGGTGVHLGDMLACKKIVSAYQTEIRDKLLASPLNAEYVIRKYLERAEGDDIHLPASLTPHDVRCLLERYLDSPDANLNYVRLIETASPQTIAATGIDAKLKLKAKRLNGEMTLKLFENTTALRAGVEVRLSDTQIEPAQCEIDDSDGVIARFTFGKGWLEDTLENASILNNFQHLFEFANIQVLLSLPSYYSQLGVFERYMFTTGKSDYRTGATFQSVQMSSILQTWLYQQYLESKDIDLEDVIAWFFNEYLLAEFGARNFSFARSTRGASYLEKVRHLFVEMESVVNQFRLFVENGELDPDLLAISSEPVLYKKVPSLLDGKYVYPTENNEIVGIIHVLFSDQSKLTYINEELRGASAAELLLNNTVAYQDFHEYQRNLVDQLINLGVLKNSGTRVEIASPQQFYILKSLFVTEATSYFHLSKAGRAEVDAMEKRGWVTRRSSLLTEAEGSYFNFLLNKVEFSNGPELRNKYLHGSQANANRDDAHNQNYITVLMLTISLIIKINDDFCLFLKERPDAEI